jgi:hypothetical protein
MNMMSERRHNWHVWAGFLLCIFGVLSYFLLFARFPSTRDVPWANFLLLAVGLALLISGISRAFRQGQQYRGKILGPILGVIGLAAAGFFCFAIFYASRQLPKSAGAPRVGRIAPEFVLKDTNNQDVSLTSLLTTPLPNSQAAPKGVLLVFYRGYW